MMILEILTFFVATLFFLVLLIAITSPLASLFWWKNRNGSEQKKRNKKSATRVSDQQLSNKKISRTIIYLSGVGDISGEQLNTYEQNFLDNLKKELADSRFIDDIFPYSLENYALTEAHLGGWLWKIALSLKAKGSVLGMIINLRNIFQVMVAIDPRYGPIYTQALAKRTMKRMKSKNYQFQHSFEPIYIVGVSGGAQLGVNLAQILSRYVNAPIYLISIGGVISSQPGLDRLTHVFHFYSNSDWIEKMGAFFLIKRWPIFRNSFWNRLRSSNRIKLIDRSPLTHTGKNNYFSSSSYSNYSSSMSNLATTLNYVKQIVHDCENFADEKVISSLSPHEIVTIVKQRDHKQIAIESRTFYYYKPENTKSILLLHGYTGSTAGFTNIITFLKGKNFNILAPRLPYHGHRSRFDENLKNLSKVELYNLLEETWQVLVKLQTENFVLGISGGANLAIYLTESYPNARGIAIAPFLNFRSIGIFENYRSQQIIINAAKLLPNQNLWFNPQKKENFEDVPNYSYPRYSTNALAEFLEIGRRASQEIFIDGLATGSRLILVNNLADNVVSPKMVKLLAEYSPQEVEQFVIPASWEMPHDLIDFSHPKAKPDLTLKLVTDCLHRFDK